MNAKPDAILGEQSAPLVLIADDDEINRLLIVETLKQAGFRTFAVADGAAALEATVSQVFDLVLLDVDMPHLDGYELCSAARSAIELRYLPVVMITGRDDAASITQAYECGATDFIAKPVNWSLLPHRLRYILRNAEADRRLRHLAYHDGLTGLPNSQGLPALISTALGRAAATGCAEGVALLQIGVPACGRIRSVFGPDAGDEALCAFARRLTDTVARTHADDRAGIARIDGDRFVVCLRERFIEERSRDLAAGILAAFAAPASCGGQEFFLTPDIGIALSSAAANEPKTLLTHAAAALLHTRRRRSNDPVLYCDDVGNLARDGLALEAKLREAVRNEGLTLHFQPKIRVSDGSLSGVEALLRWFDPDLGAVGPDRFIPLAEESGLILDIGRWVTEAACRQLTNWRHEGLDTRIAINLSARQFMHDDPAAMIEAAAEAAGIDPRSLVVEITESALIEDLGGVQAGLQAVRRLGCRVAIDDFGTGYSSLAYLKGLPVDELKIDRTFIRHLGSDRVDGAICTAVLSLARDIGLNVTAEGVETVQQFDWLREHGCTEAQGYLIARPMPGHQILVRYGVGKTREGAASGTS